MTGHQAGRTNFNAITKCFAPMGHFSVVFQSQNLNHSSDVIIGCDGVSNHQPHNCLHNRLFKRRPKKTSKLRVTGLWWIRSMLACWCKSRFSSACTTSRQPSCFAAMIGQSSPTYTRSGGSNMSLVVYATHNGDSASFLLSSSCLKGAAKLFILLPISYSGLHAAPTVPNLVAITAHVQKRMLLGICTKNWAFPGCLLSPIFAGCANT